MLAVVFSFQHRIAAILFQLSCNILHQLVLFRMYMYFAQLGSRSVFSL